MLDTHEDVVRCLLTYTDWWQPSTGSVAVTAGPTRRRCIGDGLRDEVVDGLDERTELVWRLAHLDRLDRKILFLFYVAYLSGAEIAEDVGLSERQCYRRRNRAVERLVDLGEPADVWRTSGWGA